MTRDLEQRRAAARRAILRYLEKHPEACDTVEGIQGWWLPEEGVTEGRELVEGVLEELVALGDVRRVTLPDGGEVYGGCVPPGTAS